MIFLHLLHCPVRVFLYAILGVLFLAEYFLSALAARVRCVGLFIHWVKLPDTQLLAFIAIFAIMVAVGAWLILRNSTCLGHWLLGFFYLVVLVGVAGNFDAACIRSDALVLCGGIALACAVGSTRQGSDVGIVFSSLQLAWCVMFVLGLWWPFVIGPLYHGFIRQSGLWSSPNIYGVLMGAMLVASITALTDSFIFSSPRIARIQRFICWIAGICSFLGLLFSFCRGAWVATALGILWLFMERRRGVFDSALPCLPRRYLMRFVFAVGAFALIMVCIPDAQPFPIRARLLSFVNENDLSVQNRYAAWYAGIQMLQDRPLFGYQWTPLEEIYGAWYAIDRIEDYGAIHTNDFVTLGANAGIGAIILFIGVIMAVLFAKKNRNRQETANWAHGRRACLVALLVGIGFDGGLYTLSIAIPIWYLIGIEIREPGEAT